MAGSSNSTISFALMSWTPRRHRFAGSQLVDMSGTLPGANGAAGSGIGNGGRGNLPDQTGDVRVHLPKTLARPHAR